MLSDQNKDAYTKNCNQVGLNHKSHKLFDEREREPHPNTHYIKNVVLFM